MLFTAESDSMIISWKKKSNSRIDKQEVEKLKKEKKKNQCDIFIGNLDWQAMIIDSAIITVLNGFFYLQFIICSQLDK